MNKIALHEDTDEFKLAKEQWKTKSKGMTINNLPEFLNGLVDDYEHDYGTICHAAATAAVAACWAMDHSSQGGITGFQAGAIMWEFIREWNYSDNKTGLRIIDYDNFLYPQYDDRYQKTISPSTWEAIQKEAQAHIEKADAKFVVLMAQYLIDTEKYKKDIASFIGKYPDYYEKKEYYDPLGIGTGDQWEAEDKKKKSGFEFAPQSPYLPVGEESRVYRHWKSIISGVVPFKYVVTEED